ncbi:MAG: 4-hydroxy-3-methylbut-2-enyl diphosphate reductase [Spirochaetaceae bacterium]|jgi:(E)-4-hydroxy-3-methyl-but-2-enyl pyrophosphate reductase|nr:4-hydroxy-3-methylbut-2-enyl diphosphate reductase [Spirochaetaceae bacterium]
MENVLINEARTCGMCFGAKSAYVKVVTLLERKKDCGQVILYKQLLHNKDVIQDLRDRGAIFVQDMPEQLNKEDTVVIRAHGETEIFFKRLEERQIHYVDCTCDKVKKIHALIAEKYRNGYSIVIIGDKDHAEVTGSDGWCNNEAIIISSLEDVKQIKNAVKQKIFIIVQTTFNEKKFKDLSDHIIDKYGKSSLIEIFNSLCDAQRKIHDDSVDLASKCRTMIVIGDKNSENTKQLFEKCRSVCTNTLLVECRSVLYESLLKENCVDFTQPIGITGGASTPREVIKNCMQFLKWIAFYKSAYAKIKNKMSKMRCFLSDDNVIINRIIENFIDIALSSKAKYLRGALIMLGYKIAQNGSEKTKYDFDDSLDLAAVYEFLETAVLVHDDVFDKAKKRRNIPTIQEKNSEFYKTAAGVTVKRQKNIINDAVSAAAICAGDIGFYFVNKKLLESYKNNKNIINVLAYLQEIVLTTIKGELLDILLPIEERFGIKYENTANTSATAASVEDYVLQIDTMKTATYTTIGPLGLGLLLASAAEDDITDMRKFATYLGIAFQMKDDLLDIFGTAEQGKPRGSDISEFKITMLYAAVCDNPVMKQELLEYYGHKITKKNLLQVRRIMEKSGAKQIVEKKINAALLECKRILQRISFINEENKDILYGFIFYLELRQR